MRQMQTLPTQSRTTRFAILVFAAGLALLFSGSGAQAWDSDFYDRDSYIVISGLGVLTNLGKRVGDKGSEPLRGVTSVKDSGGFRITAGTHVSPWAALQLDFMYIAPIKMRTSNHGSQEIPVYTGSLTLKGYPLAKVLESTLEGRLQPFVKVSPSVAGLAHTPIKTPVAFMIGVGGGTEYWVSENVTLNLEGAYWWGTAALKKLDYGTLSLGAAYHF